MTAATLPSTATVAPRWQRVALTLLALVFLDQALAFSTWWPTPGVLPDARLSSEFVGLWLLLLALVAWRGALSPRALHWVAVAYTVLVVGRYADVTVPSLFGREINLYWDGAQIPRLLWVTLREGQWWLALAAVVLVALLVWGLYRLLRAAIALVAREAVPYALRARWVWLVTAAAVALSVANWAGVRATWPYVSKPVIPVYARQAKLLATALSDSGVTRALPPSTALQTALALPPGEALGALRGRDVFVVFLESYGAIAYDNPRAAQAQAATRERFAADLAAGGWQVVSAFIGSPTFGGASDLAHLSLLSGIDLSDPLRHDLLLTTDRPTLNTLFRAAGYRSYGFYPALFWEWPERAYYGFDVFIEGRDVDYRGPPLGYWKIPDQVSVAWFEHRHPGAPGAPPRFVFFPTITNHWPFSPVPPYQADWTQLLTAQPYDAADVARAQAERIDWLDMMPAYLRMLDYKFRWLGDWLRRPQPREAVFVLLGDHQPTGNISGEGASWDVPIHIVTRDPELIARFTAQGFAPGLQPPRAKLGNMNDLTGMLLKAFRTEPAR
ncbi:MAG: sulfatase-like hydrolase/transferase [Betaproteobacteria bacterium]